LDDDSKTMAKPRDRSTSSSSSEDEIRTSRSNGFKYDVEKFQFLSIKELNEKLEKYIEDVKDLGLSHGKPSSNISINIDRSAVSSIHSEFDEKFDDWKKKYNEKDLQIAELLAMITKLKAEIKRLQESENRKEGLIKEKDLTIEALRSEISKLESLLSMFKNQKEIYELQLKQLKGEVAKLTGDLTTKVNTLAKEQNQNYDLECRLTALEKDLRFKIDMLGQELDSERSNTTIDIDSLDTKRRSQYDTRLEDELKILREIYSQHMKISEETLEKSYKNKVSDLEASLKAEKVKTKPTEDVTALKIEIKTFKRRIDDLDDNDRDLDLQLSKLQVQLKEKNASFAAKMAAKDKEMKYLREKTEEYRRLYEVERKKIMAEAREVNVYNELITPEFDRIQRYTDSFMNGGENSSTMITMSQASSKASTVQQQNSNFSSSS